MLLLSYCTPYHLKEDHPPQVHSSSLRKSCYASPIDFHTFNTDEVQSNAAHFNVPECLKPSRTKLVFHIVLCVDRSATIEYRVFMHDLLASNFHKTED